MTDERDATSPTTTKTRCCRQRRVSSGRPTKYRPEYCDIVESLGAQGKSPAEIAAILRVDRASLYRWAAAHEDFAQSLARAKTFEQAWWESDAQRNLGAKNYQARIWRTVMAARFKGDYSIRHRPMEILDLRLATSEATRECPALWQPVGSKP